MKRGFDIATLPFKIVFFVLTFVFKLAVNFLNTNRNTLP